MNPEKKKIIYVTVRSDFGGGPYHIDLLIKNLKDEFDIFIAAPLNEPFGIDWQRTFKNKFLEIPFRSFRMGNLLRLIRFIKKNKIDILHAHGKGGSIYGRIAKMFLKQLKVIYTPHGFHIFQYNKLMQKFYILVERFFSRYTNLFINVSQGEKEHFLKNKIFNEADSVLVYNAINNIEKIYPDKAAIRERLNLPVDLFIIVSVVRFNHQKNLKATLNIAENLLSNKDILFLIIGEGEEGKEIEDLIRKKNLSNIILPGYKSNINEYLAASDIYLSTSLWEGLPYSLIEALANGLPVVASNVTGNNEIVENGLNGYLFNLNNLNEAAGYILKIKDSDKEMQTLSQNSIRLFKEKFQLDAMIKETKNIYSNF